jgi:hypothetical protein
MRNTPTAGRRRAAGITTVAGFACALGVAVLVAGCANNPHTHAEPKIWPAVPTSGAPLGKGAASPTVSPTASPARTSSPAAKPATTAAAPKKASPTWKPPPAPTIRGSALPTPPKNAPAVTIVNKGNIAKDHHSMRIVSAKGDLTGQHDLWMVAGGFPWGDATCTQTFHLTVGAPPQVRNTMLICYRLSNTRSVYTISVDLDKSPSPAAAVAEIDSTWNALGKK